MVKYGAQTENLSFLHCYFTYQPDWPYISFCVKELNLPVDEQDIEGKTALAHCYEELKLEEMSFLLGLGSDINLGCLPDERTLAHDACLKGNYELVSFLFSKGARCDLKCRKGFNCQEYLKMGFSGKREEDVERIRKLFYRAVLEEPRF